MTAIDVERRQFLARTAGAIVAAGSIDALAQLHTQKPAASSGSLRLGGDMPVNRMGFGAMRITGEGIWGEPKDAPAARAVLRRAVALGVNFIDTADAYGPDVSERLIAEALHPYAAGLVIATKGGMTRAGPNRWTPDCSPTHLRTACESSLSRLKIERHDLYQLHAVDAKVPYEDSIGELARLQREGKIRHIGVSNVNVDQLARARALVKVVSVQNLYNVAMRQSDDVLKVCERDGLAFIPWGPLALRAQAKGATNASLPALQEIAKQRSIDMAQATLAWLLARSPVMLPIPGTSSLAHLEENIAAANIKMSMSEMTRIG